MKNQYGINIRRWCKKHECEVEEKSQAARTVGELTEILEEHSKKLHWLMHERLVHLIVLFLISIILIFSIFLLTCAPDTIPASLPLCIIVFVLACFYVRHYFFLENTVQKWYMIDEDLTERIKKAGGEVD